MQRTWQHLDTRQRTIIVIAITGGVIIAVLALTLALRSASLQAYAVGVWNCTVAYTDTDPGTYTDIYDPDGQVPAPFDVLDDFDPGLDTHTYRPPRSADQIPAFTARVTARPDGTFTLAGAPLEGETIHTGTWTLDNGLVLINFDTLDSTHAIHIQHENPHASALSWGGAPLHPDLYELRTGWHDTALDLAFNSTDSYSATCIKLTDDPGASP